MNIYTNINIFCIYIFLKTKGNTTKKITDLRMIGTVETTTFLCYVNRILLEVIEAKKVCNTDTQSFFHNLQFFSFI